MKTFITVALILILTAGYSQSQNFFSTHPENLKSDVKTLSSSNFGGRFPGNSNHNEVINFIVDFFKINHLNSIGDTYQQPFNLYMLKYEPLTLKVNNKTFIENDQFFNSGIEFLNDYTPTKIVFGGDGSPTYLNRTSIKNNLVVIYKKNIHDIIKESHYLGKQGALGIIVVAEDDKGLAMLKRTFESMKDLHRIRKDFPDTSQHFLRLYASNQKMLKTFNCKKNLLLKCLNEQNPELIHPVEALIKAPTSIKTLHTSNIAGYIKGSEKPDECIIVSAHYDHLQPKAEYYFPGADDNASGVAGMFEMIRAFNHSGLIPKRSILFIAFSAEEYGIIGSKFYVDHPLFPLSQTKVCVNLDMIGRNDEKHSIDENYLYLTGTDCSPDLHKIVMQIQNKAAINFDTTQNNSYDLTNPFHNSDHINFWNHDVPTVFFISGLHADYHQPTDTYEKLNYDVLSKRIDAICHVVWELANTNITFTINKKPSIKHEGNIINEYKHRLDSICNVLYGTK